MQCIFQCILILDHCFSLHNPRIAVYKTVYFSPACMRGLKIKLIRQLDRVDFVAVFGLRRRGTQDDLVFRDPLDFPLNVLHEA